MSNVYAMFLDLLPASYHRCVDMYHTNTESDVQERIVNSFADPSGEIRVLVATIAYGMGVDSKDVHRTVICGRTTDLDDYMQMSGRIGRDNKPSVAVMLQYPGDSAGKSISSAMKEFAEGKRCRRAVIREVFGEAKTNTIGAAHNCCDICENACACGGNNQCSSEKNTHGNSTARCSDIYSSLR